MASNFLGQRTPSSSINPINTSFPHPQSYSPIPHYSVYEKAINRELSPLSSQAYNHPDYSLSFHTNTPELTPNSHYRLNNRPPGPTNLDSSPVVSSKARSLSPRPLETATEKDEDFGEFTLASKKALQSRYHIPNNYNPQSNHTNKVTYPDNFAYNLAKHRSSPPEGTAYLYQNPSLNQLIDPQNTPYHSGNHQNSNPQTISSTKDNSPMNNNLVQNQIFLRNLENLTEILNDAYKPGPYSLSTKHHEHNYSPIISPGPQGTHSKGQSSYIPTKVNLKIELNTSNNSSFNIINTTKNPYEKSSNSTVSHAQQQALAKRSSSSSMPDAKGSNDSRRVNNNTNNNMKQQQQDQRKNAAKPIPYLNVQSRQNSKTPLRYQESSIHADSKILNIPVSDKNSVYQAIISNSNHDSNKGTSRNSARRSARGTAPISKVTKEATSATYSRTSYKDIHAQRTSYNNSYYESNSKLNYSEMRLGLPSTAGDNILSVGKIRSEVSNQSKPYWQVKAVDAKLEENKRNVLQGLLQNNPIITTKDMRGIVSRDSIQSSPYSGISTPGGHESNYERITVASQSQYPSGNNHSRLTNGDRTTVRSSHTTLDDHYSNGGSRLNTKREVSLETKRGLSGKVYIKTGDEPGDKEDKFTEDLSELERIVNYRIQESKARTSYVKVTGMRDEGVEQESHIRPDPKMLRGRIGIQGQEKVTSRSFDINSTTSIKSQTMLTGAEQEGRSLSENRSSSKDILKSLKDFGDNVVQSAKEFIHKVGHRTRSKCACSYSLKSNEDTCPRAQKWLLSKYRKSELGYLKKTYEKIRDSKDLAPACQKQIALDIRRTHPEIEFFAGSGEGVQSLERVLQCYAKYDPKIGYVQGMNFVTASILYHAEEYVAFWILILIFEKAEMRDIYMHNLPGLTKHSQIVDFLILNNIPELYSHFCTHNIVVEMFCTEWICGLFGSVIPLDKMDHFLEEFIGQGWPFFYKFILALLKSFEKDLMEAMDMSEILLIFKSGINKREKTASGAKVKIDWEKIIKSAHQIELDTSFIHKLLMRFDQEKKRFVLNSKY